MDFSSEFRDDPSDSRSEEERRIPDYCQAIRFKGSNGQVKELLFPKGLDLDRPKRARTTFSSAQLQSLEEEFRNNQYLVGKERTKLAQRLGLSETQVKVWFQNRRTKHKREKSREEEQQKLNAETMATCNILRLLQNHSTAIPSTTLTPTVQRSVYSPSSPVLLRPFFGPYCR
ncbi:ventral anterior homeobox 1-like [Tachypleus tridentatus]|uniref:ventral anterior homeobox 1-like n=1 Tax=Tachypleus tridentatus TaxID=6853 RepID=UPI003FD3FBAF